MLDVLKGSEKVIGVKQTKRAVITGAAAHVFLAEDAEERITAPVRELCTENSVPVTEVDTMRELGSACGIEVGAAMAAILQKA